jgi:WD40 repeat protein
VLKGHTEPVVACAVSPDGSFVVSAGGGDQTLRIWDRASGAERHVLKGHTERVSDCAVSPDGYSVVSASEDGTVRIWDTGSGDERHILRVGDPRSSALRCGHEPCGGALKPGSYYGHYTCVECGRDWAKSDQRIGSPPRRLP